MHAAMRCNLEWRAWGTPLLLLTREYFQSNLNSFTEYAGAIARRSINVFPGTRARQDKNVSSVALIILRTCVMVTVHEIRYNLRFSFSEQR